MQRPGILATVLRRQRRTQVILLIITLTTLPFYCVGFVLLALAPQPTQVAPTGVPTQVTTLTTAPTVTDISGTSSPTPLVDISTATQYIYVPPTPLQLTYASPIPIPFTWTPIPPTWTPFVIIITSTGIPHPPPTSTPHATGITPSATAQHTLSPTATFTVVPPTLTHTLPPPTSTNTPIPATATFTVVPPTLTHTLPPPPTSTNTPISPTSTFTLLPPTATHTPPPPPTLTNTLSLLLPTATATIAH